jgi:hypothetical protein
MNWYQRRAATAEQRKNRRREIMALTAEVLAKLAADNKEVTRATLILPDVEVQFIDAAMLRRGERA